MAPAHGALAAAGQERDEGSTLHFARALIALRKAHPVLRMGEIRVLEASDQVLTFERVSAASRALCVFNLSRSPATATCAPDGLAPILQVGSVARAGGQLNLGALSAIILEGKVQGA
jgi:alpha-glucosidase